MEKSVEITVIAPMFNEAPDITRNVGRFLEALKKRDDQWEMILVNDGSTDETLELVNKLAENEPRLRVISYAGNRGRGYALRQGFRAARGEFVITTESDLNWGTEIIDALYKKLKNTDAEVVIASPYLKGGRLENIPFKRAFLSRFGNKLLTFSVPGNLTMLSGMTRGYRREVLDSLELEADGKEIHLEIVAKCLALGYRIVEIPAVLRWDREHEKKSKRVSKFHARKLILSHLAFSFYQKPMMIFGLAGLIMVLGGLVLALVFAVQFIMRTLYPARPIYLLMVILLVAGIQMLSFGFVANQIGSIKKEIYRLQRQTRRRD